MLDAEYKKHKKMFDGILGKHTGSDNTIELKEDAKPYHAKPFLFRKISNQLVKTS